MPLLKPPKTDKPSPRPENRAEKESLIRQTFKDMKWGISEVGWYIENDVKLVYKRTPEYTDAEIDQILNNLIEGNMILF